MLQDLTIDWPNRPTQKYITIEHHEEALAAQQRAYAITLDEMNRLYRRTVVLEELIEGLKSIVAWFLRESITS